MLPPGVGVCASWCPQPAPTRALPWAMTLNARAMCNAATVLRNVVSEHSISSGAGNCVPGPAAVHQYSPHPHTEPPHEPQPAPTTC